MTKKKSTVRLCVFNLADRPQGITINGKAMSAKQIMWNPVKNKLMIDVECTTQSTEIVIQK